MLEVSVVIECEKFVVGNSNHSRFKWHEITFRCGKTWKRKRHISLHNKNHSKFHPQVKTFLLSAACITTQTTKSIIKNAKKWHEYDTNMPKRRKQLQQFSSRRRRKCNFELWLFWTWDECREGQCQKQRKIRKGIDTEWPKKLKALNVPP